MEVNALVAERLDLVDTALRPLVPEGRVPMDLDHAVTNVVWYPLL